MYLETISSRYFSEMPDVEIIDMKKRKSTIGFLAKRLFLV